jgi:hypothetical protein
MAGKVYSSSPRVVHIEFKGFRPGAVRLRDMRSFIQINLNWATMLMKAMGAAGMKPQLCKLKLTTDMKYKESAHRACLTNPIS